MTLNIADRLTQKIVETKAPIVVGLDPVIEKIPSIFKDGGSDGFAGAGKALLSFSKTLIDIVKPLVPAVKPQIAFYEMYGSYGVKAFEDTVAYAKANGLVVIEDGKRNDIGNTALAYAEGHLGQVPLISGKKVPSFDVDFLTVSPFLGPESLQPFFRIAVEQNKGLFVLVKTSNEGSGAIQDVKTSMGHSISEELAHLVHMHAQKSVGKTGYSAIGAVVGATYPEEAKRLRKRMPNSILLVPGYGAQGAGAEQVVPNFNEDGLGAIVNASRSINYAYLGEYDAACTLGQFEAATESAVRLMQKEIYLALKSSCKRMAY